MGWGAGSRVKTGAPGHSEAGHTGGLTHADHWCAWWGGAEVGELAPPHPSSYTSGLEIPTIIPLEEKNLSWSKVTLWRLPFLLTTPHWDPCSSALAPQLGGKVLPSRLSGPRHTSGPRPNPPLNAGAGELVPLCGLGSSPAGPHWATLSAAFSSAHLVTVILTLPSHSRNSHLDTQPSRA